MPERAPLTVGSLFYRSALLALPPNTAYNPMLRRCAVKAFSNETRQRMSEAAKRRCTEEWRIRQSGRMATKLDVREVQRLYESGMTQTEVATALGTTQKVIHGFMRRNGLTARVAAKRNQFGHNNSTWKGDAASYAALHYRIEWLKGKPSRCEVCGTADPDLNYDWANLTGHYEDSNDYKRMCRSCHWKYDGKVQNITGGVKCPRKLH